MQDFRVTGVNYQSGIDYAIGKRSGRITDAQVLKTFYTRIVYAHSNRSRCPSQRNQGPTALGGAHGASHDAGGLFFRLYQKARDALSAGAKRSR